MLKNDFLQYAVLKFAVAINSDGFGRSTIWGALANDIRELISDITDSEIMNVLLFLHGRQHLILQKFSGDVPYWTLTEYHEFPMKNQFFNGQFLLLATFEGESRLQELEAKLYEPVPVAPKRKRIGFLP
jgi:hypothetical protein